MRYGNGRNTPLIRVARSVDAVIGGIDVALNMIGTDNTTTKNWQTNCTLGSPVRMTPYVLIRQNGILADSNNQHLAERIKELKKN